MSVPSLAGPDRMAATRPATAVLGVAVALLGVGALVAALPGDAHIWSANLASTTFALAGGAGCLRGAWRAAGRVRLGWVALAVACWSWGTGQVIWTVYENVLGDLTPYPSFADLGYLLFPVAALVGLILLAPPSSGLATPRRVLDALMVGAAFGLLSWIAVISAIIDSADGSVLALVVSLAYPLADVVLLTVTVLTVAETRDEPLRWGLLAAAVFGMALSDVMFAYEVGLGTYVTGTIADVGWWAAFALMGAAGLVTSGAPAAPVGELRPAVGIGLLPYVPLAGAFLVGTSVMISGEKPGPTGLILLVALVVLVLTRQYITVRENQRLMRTVVQREVELHRLAFHDGLTGLANRSLFLDRLTHALTVAQREQRAVAVAFLDLDGFKAVNDSLGHAAGDALLVQVAHRLSGAVRASDTLARLGGDEFAVLIEHGDPGFVANALLAELNDPFPIDGRVVAMSASVGVATASPGAGPAQAATVLHRADVAMYAVKTSGKAGVAMHSPMLATVSRHTDLPLYSAFVEALQSGRVQAVYQPVVDPADGRIAALEALARWNHNGVDVPPEVFVPMCVRGGLSEQLTATMLEQACSQLGDWNDALGHLRLRMAVNLDPSEFTDSGLPERIEDLLRRHHLGRGQLVLEITEVGMINRAETMVDVMLRLREIGVRLSLDDFGTGYSSLARLSQIPLDTVKIDRFFVADIDHDLRQRRFLVGLFQLTRHLGLRTVAEGVERPGQLRELGRLGCDLVQGHLIARPSPGADLTSALLADSPMLAPHLLLRRPG